MSDLEQIQEEAKEELQDLTKETHTQEQILEEAQKLCSFILGSGKIDAHKVAETQKLNHDNPVHLMGLVGIFYSDIILKELQRVTEENEKLKKELNP